MKLRIVENLINIKNIEDTLLTANLQCTCGATEFKFSHTGKQTKGILSSYIVKKKGQLKLKAICPCCGRVIIVYDSTKDGVNPRDKGSYNEFVPLVSEKLPSKFPIVIKYNYFPEKFKFEDTYSNHFEMCFIYILDEFGNEGKPLIEE